MLDQLYTLSRAAVASLGVDFAIFMTARRSACIAAAATGYVAGIVCHWVDLQRLLVQRAALASDAAARRSQQGLSMWSALVGLGIAPCDRRPG